MKASILRSFSLIITSLLAVQTTVYAATISIVVEPQSTVSSNNRAAHFNWQFESESGAEPIIGQYACGSYWVAPAEGDNAVRLIALTGSGNAGQTDLLSLDADPLPHAHGLVGFDKTYGSYSSDENDEPKLPLLYTPPADSAISLVAAMQRNEAETSGAGTRAILGGAVDAYCFVTVLPTPPPNNGSNAIRPNIVGDEKEFLTWDDFDLSRLPSHAFIGSHASSLLNPLITWNHSTEVFSMYTSVDGVYKKYSEGGRAFRAHILHHNYGGGWAASINTTLLKLMGSDPLEIKQRVLASILAHGLDGWHLRYGIADHPGAWSSGAAQSGGTFNTPAFMSALLRDPAKAIRMRKTIVENYTDSEILRRGPQEMRQILRGQTGALLWGDNHLPLAEKSPILEQLIHKRYWSGVLAGFCFEGAIGECDTSGGKRTTADPHGYIDGPSRLSGTGYLSNAAGSARAFAALMLLFPEFGHIANSREVIEYADRVGRLGIWSWPDPVAAPTIVDQQDSDCTPWNNPGGCNDYRIAWGPTQDDRRYAIENGIGRYPRRHGVPVNLTYTVNLVEQNWDEIISRYDGPTFEDTQVPLGTVVAPDIYFYNDETGAAFAFLRCATFDVTIHYEVGDSKSTTPSPSTTSPVYTDFIPIEVGQVIKAYAVKNEMVSSSVSNKQLEWSPSGLRRIIYVATTGNDANDGSSPENAVQTINRGVALANDASDIVEVAAGSYGDTVITANAVTAGFDTNLMVRAASGDEVILNSIKVFAKRITLSNLKVSGGVAVEYGADHTRLEYIVHTASGYWENNADHVTWYYCQSNNPFYAASDLIRIGSSYHNYRPLNMLIEGCCFQGSSITGSDGNHIDLVQVIGARSVTFKDSVFYKAPTGVFMIGPGPIANLTWDNCYIGGGSFYLNNDQYPNTVVKNCVIEGSIYVGESLGNEVWLNNKFSIWSPANPFPDNFTNNVIKIYGWNQGNPVSVVLPESNTLDPNVVIAQPECPTQGSATDFAAPIISALGVNQITSSSAVITWTSNEAATSVVDYGTTTAYGSTASTAGLQTSHSVTLNNLTGETEYRFQVRSQDAAGNETTSTDFTFTTLAPDLIAPTCNLTAPTNGTTLLGQVELTATATDNNTITSVEFLLNGNALGTGTSVNASTFIFSWNTIPMQNGSYTLQAVATDGEGNQGFSSTANITINNPLPDLTDGLVAYWDFNDNSGTTATDSSGNNYHAIIQGAAWATGVGESALDFDGVDDYVNAGPVPIDGNAMTLALWFKADDFGIADARLISQANGTAGDAHHYMLSTINSSGIKLRCRLKVAGNTTTLIANTGNLQTNEWMHAAAVYDGANLTLYLDGQVVGTTLLTGPITASTTLDTHIGSNSPNAKFFDGQMDDVRIYNRALTVNEVEALVLEGSNSSGDTTAPTVALTAPADNTILSDSVLITATASDDVAVQQVAFALNGNQVAVETTAPYQYIWDTTQVTDGQYTITVVATDSSGNASTALNNVTIDNSSGAGPQSYSDYQFTYTIGSPTDDDDGDQMPNLFEYFVGTDPTATDAMDAVLWMESDVTNAFFYFISPVAGRDDLQIEVQKSTDMSTWTTIASRNGSAPWTGDPSLLQTPQLHGMELIEISEPMGDNERCFYRLRLQQNSESLPPSEFSSTPFFEDDFNNPIDESIWQIATWQEHGGQTGRERCYTEGGYLNMLFINDSTRGYLSSAIQTRTQFLYGRWEARLKPSAVPGVLNSMFTIDWDDGNGTKQEIDIEFLTRSFGINSGEVHYAVHAQGLNSFQTNPDVLLDFNPSDDFHIWGFEITPEHIRWFVDDQTLLTYTYAEHDITIDSDYQLKFNVWSNEGWIQGPPAADVACLYQIDWIKFYPYIGPTQ